MDTKNDVRRGKTSKAWEDIGLFEVILKFHNDKGLPDTCATSKNFKLIDSSCTSPGIDILQCGFIPFHDPL